MVYPFRGLDVNWSNLNGETPLHQLVSIKDPTLERDIYDTIEYLLSRGADPLRVDKLKNTPIHRATLMKRSDLVHLM